MEVQVEKPSPTSAKIACSVGGDEFRALYKQGLNSFRQRVRMKGFRPGKAPLPMIEKHHGEEVKGEVQQHFVQQAYSKAVQEHELKPFAHPRVPHDAAKLDADWNFSVEFEVALRPEVVLGTYKALGVESELEPVLEENVSTTLDEIRRQQSRPEPVGDEGMTEQGMAVADVRFLHGEETVFSKDGLRLSPLTPPPGVDGDAWKAALVGQKEGAELSLPMTLPETLEQEQARGQEGTCTVTVSQAYNMVPPTDEELCTLVGVEDMAAVTNRVRERLEEAAQQREHARIEGLLLDQVIAASQLELPESIVGEQTEARLHQLRHQLQGQGLAGEDLDKELESQRPVARDEAAKGLKALLVVESIGEAESLLVQNEELQAELESIAARNRADLEEVRKYYAENNLFHQLAVEVLERKVRTFLREQAEVKEPS